MPSIVAILATVLILYFIRYPYNFIRNYLDARKSNFAYFCVPRDQNHFIWMIISVPLRPWLAKNLPSWIFDKLSLTIYGLEFHEKLRPFAEYAADESSYIMVTPGKYEFMTKDPEIAMEILKRPRDFQQHDLTRLFMNRFGSNTLTTDGDTWVRQRRIIASTINERISKTVFEESIKHVTGLLAEIGTDGTNGIFDMMKKITVNVLSGAGMGESVAWEDGENEKPKVGFKTTYMEAVKAVVEAVAGPIILPMWFLRSYPSFLPGHQFLKNLSVAVEEFPMHTEALLEQERQRSVHAGGSTRSNIMSQLLQASAQDGETKTGVQALSEEEIKGNLFIFTAAGFDTTANTLSYALVLLCRYPKWQTWMFEEIDRILPAGQETTDMEYQDLFPKASRVLALMFETLRLYPPVIHHTKQTKQPQTIISSCDGKRYWFPPNATIYINTVAVQIAPEIWRNLNLQPGESEKDDDENVFRPTRWFNPDSNAMYQPPKGYFLPWSSGPRVCPGQKMAQVEFVSIFLTLFRRHRIEAVPLKGESEKQLGERLDGRLIDSFPILTLQMRDVYDMKEGDERGLRVRLVGRR